MERLMARGNRGGGPSLIVFVALPDVFEILNLIVGSPRVLLQVSEARKFLPNHRNEHPAVRFARILSCPKAPEFITDAPLLAF
jgi:hypothetical protein